MEIIITTNDCTTSDGFNSRNNPVVVALKFAQPSLEKVEFHNGRITATREGYLLRFLVKDFSVSRYRDLMYGNIVACKCNLEPLPVALSEMSTH